jgi:hypothetical protein
MPINYPDFARIASMYRQDPDVGRFGAEELISGLERGMKLGSMPGQLMREREAAEIANRIKGVEAKYAAPMAEADLRNKLAAAMLHERQGKEYGTTDLMRNMQMAAGGDDKIAQALMKEYYGAGTSAGGRGGRKYAPTNLGKLYQERDKVVGEFGEDSPQAESYNLAILKATSDVDARKRNLFATNLVQSINSASVDDLTRYSGPKGQAKLLAERARDAIGNPSEDYIKHKEAQKAVALEAQELRQFLGTSITPQMDIALREMVDATGPLTSQETAKRMINKSRGIIKKQLGTYRKAVQSPSAYTGELEEEVYPAALQKGPSDSDIEFTARKYGMTPAQVRQQLGM